MAEKNNIELSILLPAFNEENNIGEVIHKVIQASKENHYKAEIIIVDDGSTDDTGVIADDLAHKNSNLKVFHHNRNKGLTESLETGFKNSSGEIIVFLCSDQQSNPLEDIPKLVDKIKEGYDVALGWRQGRRGIRSFVSRIYHLLSKIFFGVTFHDMNWIKAFRAEVVKDLKLRSDWHRYIPILAESFGYKITEVKTNYYPRRYGKSKFGKNRIVSGFFDFLTIKFQISFMKRPMFFFGTLGLVFLISGFLLIIGLAMFVVHTRFNIQPAKVWYILLLLLFIVGLNFISLGFLAEFLVTITEKLKSLEEKIITK